MIGTGTNGGIAEGYVIANKFLMGNADYAEYFRLESNTPGDASSGYPTEDDYIGYFAAYNLGTENVTICSSMNDKIVGVFTSPNGTSCIQGDAAPIDSANKYLIDDYGRRIMRDSYIPSLADLYPSVIPSVPLDPGKTNGELMDGQELLVYLLNNNLLTSGEIALLEARSIPTVSSGYNPNLEYIPRSERPNWALVSLLGKVYVRQNGSVTAGTYCKCENGIAVPGGDAATGWYVLSVKSAGTVRIEFYKK